MLQDRTGLLWFGTSSGISQYDGASFRPFEHNDSVQMRPSPFLNNEFLMQYDAENVWICGRGTEGVQYFDGQTIRTVRPAGPSWGTFLGPDRAGGLWFGMANNKVYRYDGATFLVVGEGHLTKWVTGMAEDEAGNFWFTSAEGGGVKYYDGVKYTRYTAIDGFASDDVSDVLIDQSGVVWALTQKGGRPFRRQSVPRN